MYETYRKSARAQSSDGWESWVQDDLANTVNGFDVGDIRATTLALYFETRFARNGRGAPSEIASALKAEAGMTGKGDAAPMVLISSTEGSPARTYQWQASGPVLGASVAASGLSSSASCPSCGHDGRSLRMSPDSYPLTKDATSPSSSTVWKTSGTASGGRYWTRKTSESRNAAAACSLSQVLQDEASSKFYLSAKAAAGILRRAQRRERELPTHLKAALLALLEESEEGRITAPAKGR